MSRAEGHDRDYEVLLARLYSARRFGMRLELERIASCLERLGRPQARFAAVAQVGGTNGKGSTAAFTDSILRAAGIRTGLYTSPHLVRLSERFRVGGVELEPSALLEADRAVAGAAAAAGVDLTFFERLTAMAVWAFADVGVEVAVLEVGMGGRFDATTAVGAQVAAVTGVALDHQDYLGSTLAEIAREKAGIFRPGQRAVVGASGEPEAVPFLCHEAQRAGVAALTVLQVEAIAAVPLPSPAIGLANGLRAGTPEGAPAGLTNEPQAGPAQEPQALGLAGPHQRANAACALAVIDHLEAVLGRSFPAQVRSRGLADCRLPGRLEMVAASPTVVIDGAHNPHAARALAAALREMRPARRVLVLAVSRDKDAAGIAAALAGGMNEIVVTATRHERALGPEALADAVRAAVPAASPRRAPDTASALALARDLAGPDGAVIVTGSLFLAGEARESLCGDRADPRPMSDPLP